MFGGSFQATCGEYYSTIQGLELKSYHSYSSLKYQLLLERDAFTNKLSFSMNSIRWNANSIWYWKLAYLIEDARWSYWNKDFASTTLWECFLFVLVDFKIVYDCICGRLSVYCDPIICWWWCVKIETIIAFFISLLFLLILSFILIIHSCVAVSKRG